MTDQVENVPQIDWALLTRPLDPEDIEWLRKGKPHAGAQGKAYVSMVPYIKMQALRRRLDEVCPGLWSWDAHHIPFTSKVQADALEPFAVEGTLTIDVRDGSKWGSSISRTSVGIGTSWKEAETDAFKRAGQRLGVGNELYGEIGNQEVEVDNNLQPIDPKGNYLRSVDPESYPIEEKHETPLVNPRTAPAGTPPVQDGLKLACPDCGGVMWDNRVGKKNPRSPDWKCRDRTCEGVWWKTADYEKAKAEEEAARGTAENDIRLELEQDDNLPF